MSLLDVVNRAIQPYVTRFRNLIVRAVVGRVDDSTKWQRVDIEAMVFERLTGVPVFQPYGFACNPAAPDNDSNPEALVLRVGGKADAPVVIAISDIRHRLRNLAVSEVAVYSAQGQTIIMKNNGEIVITAAPGAKIRLESDTTVDADLVVTGDVHSQGTVKGDTDCVTGSISLKGHVHAGTDPLSTPPGALLDGNSLSVTGSTAPPTP
jgi:phage gp45-like